MDKGVTCEHLNKLSEYLTKDLWSSKDLLQCFDCGCPGPNLWICLQPDCHHVGCSEVKNDHSTIHQKNYPSHCVHMNISTERIWCYLCEKEVHIRAAIAHREMNPDSTSLESAIVGRRLGSVGLNFVSPEDTDPEDMDYEDDSRPRGLVGLQNMGNTCYMNAALQALSNTVPLTSYFLECGAAVAVLAADKKPQLSRAYQKLIRDMWSRKTRGYVVPNGILYGIRNMHPMFRGYHQHDTQEFLRCFMDQLHEELKEPVWDSTLDDKLDSEADGDHQAERAAAGGSRDTITQHPRRRAASSGANDAPYFRPRRHSPAPSCYSDTRADAHLRRRAASSGANDAPYFRPRRHSPAPSCYSDTRADAHLRMAAAEGSARHRRSASFAGTHHTNYMLHASPQFNGPESTRDIGSESELSCSSEAEERYETCSSGASDVPDCRPERPAVTKASKPSKPVFPCGGGDGGSSGGVRYRSVISDVFDGKLLSAVQCLICDRVSTRVETFQDLSLPIPSREHLAVLRCQQPALTHHTPAASQDSWVNYTASNLWWVVSWLRSWFYGPVVSLQDCLAAFFSADELKGDNMYSCSRCNKLRNGVKLSGVMRLPEVLCVHLKRFRHELMFSAKVAARVSFPLHDLNMAPYTHKDCTSKITRYDLSAVICHSGTAGGGHYTCLARNPRGWYCFDDTCVTPISPHQLATSEAYVLFYRKVNPKMAELRAKAAEILDSTVVEPNDIKFYLSKQWINKFNTWAEPGPIDNSDFVCRHGGVRPDRAAHLPRLAARVPQSLWEFLYAQFGGGPAVSHAHECSVCARAAVRLRTRRAAERQAFAELHAIFQARQDMTKEIENEIAWNSYFAIRKDLKGDLSPAIKIRIMDNCLLPILTLSYAQNSEHEEQERPRAIYAISMHWFRQWQAFVRNKTQQPPPPVDNTGILTKQEIDGVTQYILKPGSDHAQLSEELWRFFTEIYGGGPEVKLKSPQQPQPNIIEREPIFDNRRLSRKYSESDKEDYCAKSTSEMNIRESIQGELQKNQSLQNINRRYKISKSAADSDEEVTYRHTFHYKREPNGNYDSDEDMDVSSSQTYVNTVRMENGVDSSDHDANDNPVYRNNERVTDSDLPNLDSISLKSKPSKTGKVRKVRRRMK